MPSAQDETVVAMVAVVATARRWRKSERLGTRTISVLDLSSAHVDPESPTQIPELLYPQTKERNCLEPTDSHA